MVSGNDTHQPRRAGDTAEADIPKQLDAARAELVELAERVELDDVIELPALVADSTTVVELPTAVLPVPVPEPAEEQLPLPDRVTAGSMLLLELPGEWAADALQTANLPAAVRDTLTGFAERHDAHVLLIRRPEAGETGAGVGLFLSVPDHEGLVISCTLDGLQDLDGLDLDTAARHAAACRIPQGWAEAEPMILIATNNSSNQRLHGHSVAAHLYSIDPDNVWESSHRFGAAQDVNALLLPSGQVYTAVTTRDADMLIEVNWRNHVQLDKFAGRAHLSSVQQLAETALRRRLLATAEASVTPLEVTQADAASGDAEDGSFRIERIVTRWRIFPNLIADNALAQMSPSVLGQPSADWRVVVDRAITSDGAGRSEHLSVVEISSEDEPGFGVIDWDDAHRHAEEALPLPDPTVVAEISQLTPGRALDLGSGAGRHSVWLASAGWQVTAVDFSRSGLWRLAEEAGKRNLGVRAELADLRDWTPGGTKFDLILVSHVHVRNVFQNTAGWLSPTGRIVVVGPAEEKSAITPAASVREHVIDYVRLAARATGARLRVLRAGEVERVTDEGSTVRDAIVVAARPA